MMCLASDSRIIFYGWSHTTPPNTHPTPPLDPLYHVTSLKPLRQKTLSPSYLSSCISLHCLSQPGPYPLSLMIMPPPHPLNHCHNTLHPLRVLFLPLPGPRVYPLPARTSRHPRGGLWLTVTVTSYNAGCCRGQ
jgi:hypothetical protein